MAPDLPDDVLHLICSELAASLDFSTLFTCALAGKRFAAPALTNLYRIHHRVGLRDAAEALPFAEQELILRKWSILWRSIILSSLQKTIFPYCRYLRHLNLKELSELLQDDKFRGVTSNKFFGGDLKKFHVTMDTPLRPRGRRIQRPNVPVILQMAANSITEHSPLLEELYADRLDRETLTELLPRLSRLKALQVWDGSAFADERISNLIHVHCPFFEEVSFYTWDGDNADFLLPQFIRGLRPNTLRSFENISRPGLPQEVFLALDTHQLSLTSLRLALDREGLRMLSNLSDCTAIQSLRVEEFAAEVWPDDSTHDEMIGNIIRWLLRCKQLQELRFIDFSSAARLVTPLLRESSTKLQKLEIEEYVMKDQRAFHEALAFQKTLHSLFLNGDAEDCDRDDMEALCNSLCQLTELRELALRGVTAYFPDELLIRIARSLPHLEDFFAATFWGSDELLECFADLKELRSMTITGITKFTFQGLLDFVGKLERPGNEGLTFSVDMADPDHCLTEEEQQFVRNAIAERVGGRFDYILWRGAWHPDGPGPWCAIPTDDIQDPNVSEFEGESD